MGETDELEDRFELEKALGRGGMGVVFLATQRALSRPVALKLLTEDLASAPEFRDRFLTEARLAARISHPNVVKLLDFDVLASGAAYIAYELVQGGDLDRLLARGPIEVGRARSIVRDLADGLRAIHEQGILHRDLKPANVLVDTNGVARLTDLGIARDLLDKHHRTRTGTILGTVDYVSPEQIQGGALSPATDVYSLGALCYTMLVGKPPFGGASAGEILASHLEDEPVAPTRLVPGADRLLSQWAQAALAKRPEDRPTLSDLISSLEAAEPAPSPRPGTAPGATAALASSTSGRAAGLRSSGSGLVRPTNMISRSRGPSAVDTAARRYTVSTTLPEAGASAARGRAMSLIGLAVGALLAMLFQRPAAVDPRVSSAPSMATASPSASATAIGLEREELARVEERALRLEDSVRSGMTVVDHTLVGAATHDTTPFAKETIGELEAREQALRLPIEDIQRLQSPAATLRDLPGRHLELLIRDAAVTVAAVVLRKRIALSIDICRKALEVKEGPGQLLIALRTLDYFSPGEDMLRFVRLYLSAWLARLQQIETTPASMSVGVIQRLVDAASVASAVAHCRFNVEDSQRLMVHFTDFDDSAKRFQRKVPRSLARLLLLRWKIARKIRVSEADVLEIRSHLELLSAQLPALAPVIGELQEDLREAIEAANRR